MAIYVVMEPAGEREASEKVVFLRDGFSIPAFIFGPFWLFWNRAYLAAGLWLALLTMLAVEGTALRLPPEATALINFALSLALGFEGVRLIIWTLERRGFRQSGVVACDNAQEAEEVFFHNRRAAYPSSRPYSKEGA
ncbi:MAG TPA: DUF2628 domain-containing protein [Methylocystis sp.]|nr:DUF2628 domain-containing protein [Methylocystis sp.]